LRWDDVLGYVLFPCTSWNLSLSRSSRHHCLISNNIDSEGAHGFNKTIWSTASPLLSPTLLLLGLILPDVSVCCSHFHVVFVLQISIHCELRYRLPLWFFADVGLVVAVPAMSTSTFSGGTRGTFVKRIWSNTCATAAAVFRSILRHRPKTMVIRFVTCGYREK